MWRCDVCVSASGSVPCTVVSTAAVAKEIFLNNDAVFSSRPNLLSYVVKYDRKTMGTTPNGAYWQQARSYSIPDATRLMRGPDQRKFAT